MIRYFKPPTKILSIHYNSITFINDDQSRDWFFIRKKPGNNNIDLNRDDMFNEEEYGILKRSEINRRE